MRLLAGWLMIMCASPTLAQQAGLQEEPVLRTLQTGTMISTGLDDPRYLMSFLPAQRLVLRIVKAGPVPVAEAQEALKGLPFDISRLEKTGVLRRDAGSYRIAHMVLTNDDQRQIFNVARNYGISLAQAFIAAKPRYGAIVGRYPREELKADLLFNLVAGYTLNWDGLRVGTELGMRAKPTTKPNGDRYILYSKERGAGLDGTGLYWGSHSSNPLGNVRLTTFGDPPSQPRLGGLPDIYFEMDAEQLKPRPALYGAVNAQIGSMMDEVLLDQGKIMLALRDGPKTVEQLRQATGDSAEDVDQALAVLSAADYAELRDGGYRAKIVTLTEIDRPMIDEARRLGMEILSIWLKANYPKIKSDLAELDVTEAGVDFTYTFSEVWHYIFGFTTKELAERGFYTNPRAPNRTHVGFVPVVFAADLAPMP